MIDPHREMRNQRTLNVPHHLLRRKLRSRQHVNLIYRSTVTRNDPGRNDTRESEDKLFRALYRENTTRYR